MQDLDELPHLTVTLEGLDAVMSPPLICELVHKVIALKCQSEPSSSSSQGLSSRLSKTQSSSARDPRDQSELRESVGSPRGGFLYNSAEYMTPKGEYTAPTPRGDFVTPR